MSIESGRAIASKQPEIDAMQKRVDDWARTRMEEIFKEAGERYRKLAESIYGLNQPKGVPMRVLNIAPIRNTQVLVMDEPGSGNACHKYEIHGVRGPNEPTSVLGIVNFQNGPVKEAGINGVTNEDLLSIVADRLQGFQSGPYACRDNDLALAAIEAALHRLTNRTRQREVRGVEGTNIV